ncbi:MAG: type II secretion system protein GspE, partial [Deltaproteobacteria bacterium]|nr:type II secretion system protein GspE [Deltaproteobacteria bacterium]
ECRYTGFRGRTAIFEYLPVDDDIRKEITERSSNERIKDVAISKGLITLRQDGWRKVRKGVTTIAEVLKVTLEK